MDTARAALTVTLLASALGLAAPDLRASSPWSWEEDITGLTPDIYSVLYDPATVRELSGTIEEVVLRRSAPLGPIEVRIRVRMESELVNIQLAPLWYLDRCWMLLEPGDTIEATASCVIAEGEILHVAERMAAGDEWLRLRTPDGRALWMPATLPQVP